jgi:hypothetical protein
MSPNRSGWVSLCGIRSADSEGGRHSECRPLVLALLTLPHVELNQVAQSVGERAHAADDLGVSIKPSSKSVQLSVGSVCAITTWTPPSGTIAPVVAHERALLTAGTVRSRTPTPGRGAVLRKPTICKNRYSVLEGPRKKPPKRRCQELRPCQRDFYPRQPAGRAAYVSHPAETLAINTCPR